MFLCIYILTSLRLNLNISGYVIEVGDGLFENCTAPMVDLGMYEFKILNTYKITFEIFHGRICRKTLQIGKDLRFYCTIP